MQYDVERNAGKAGIELNTVFELETSTLLNPASVTVTVNGAWDQNGNPVAGVTGDVEGIF